MKRPGLLLGLAAALALAGCQSPAGELSGLAGAPPLDYAVFVTGGAFLSADAAHAGTFVTAPPAAAGPGGTDGQGGGAAGPAEPIALQALLDVLHGGRVFRRVELDRDPARRAAVREQLRQPAAAPELQQFLQQARDDGFDLLLVIEELQDGPIEAQGINGRWPVTFATWILLGVGVLIPDHTFESRATLRVTVRDLQGRILYDPLLTGGPIDLSLSERTDLWGLLASIVVPPFWVGDDQDSVGGSVRAVTERRLLLSLARELKAARQRLRERSAASLTLQDQGGVPLLVVDAADSLSGVRLRCEPPLPDGVGPAFEAALLGSLRPEGGRFRYQAPLPADSRGRLVQVLAATIRGDVASATFAPGRPQ